MMSECPAYLGLTIFNVDSAAVDSAPGETEDQGSMAMLLRSDLLIFCPSNFTVNVRLGPLPVTADASSDTETLRSIVVRFADSGRLPFYVRLTQVRSNASDGPVHQETHAGARRRSSPAPTASKTADSDTDFTDGNILIAIAITGVLVIVVYVGQNAARATTHIAGTLLSTLSQKPGMRIIIIIIIIITFCIAYALCYIHCIFPTVHGE